MRYPFDTLEIGEAFDIPITDMSHDNVNRQCRYYSGKLNRTFRYRKLASEGVYEVSRHPLGATYRGVRPSAPVVVKQARRRGT